MRAFTGICGERHDLPDVQREDEREHREQQRRVAHAVGADGLEDDAVVDEVDRALGEVLDADRNEGLLAAAHEHQPEHQDDREPHQDHDLVDAKGS